jgi:hypothetical protein
LESKTVTQIFNTTVYGGGANVVGKASNSQLTVSVIQHDRESLFEQLRDHGVTDDDLVVLDEALRGEPRPVENGKFGPRVASWIAQMIGKASTGVWEIGVGAAGDLLAAAIGQYYGIG